MNTVSLQRKISTRELVALVGVSRLQLSATPCSIKVAFVVGVIQLLREIFLQLVESLNKFEPL